MDSFERYKYETERLRKRMQKDRRLVVDNSDSGNIKRKPLSDISNRSVRHGNHPGENVISKQHLFQLHKQVNKPRHATPRFSYSIADFVNVHKPSQEDTKVFGVSNRFRKFETEFKSIDPSYLSNEEIELLRVFYSIWGFVRWFKINKFDYIIHDPNNELKRRILNNVCTPSTLHPPSNTKSSLNSICETYKYVRPEFLKNELEVKPTHLILKVQRIGKFMYSAELSSLATNNSCIVLLIAADTRFSLTNDSLIALNENDCYLHNTLSVYTRWYIYTDTLLDIQMT